MLLAGWGRIGIEVGSADNTHRLLTDPTVAGLSGCYFVGHRESRCVLWCRLWVCWDVILCVFCACWGGVVGVW